MSVGMDKLNVDVETGLLHGHCGKCGAYISVRRFDIKAALQKWREDWIADEERMLGQWRRLRKERVAERLAAIAERDLVNKLKINGHLKRLRDSIDKVLTSSASQSKTKRLTNKPEAGA